jgi:hypothetical protein
MPAIKVPPVTISAIGNGRKVTLNKIGLPALLIFHGRNTAEAAREINGPVRDKYPEASDLFVASITDLHIAPRLLRGVVEAFIKDAYEEAVKELPNGWTPRDYLLLLPDWDGKITKAFGFDNTDKQAGLAALDRQGNVVGIYQGKDLVINALALLEKIDDSE